MTTSGYSLAAYGDMIKCEPRTTAYVEALRRSITPGCHVIDLGAGPGHFGLLACKLGAGHVTIIEPDATIHIAERAARDNGVHDRITFVKDLSQNWEPNEKADVVISDIRGVMPLFEHHIPTIVDIRTRVLKPKGIHIPGVDRIYAALANSPKFHDGRSRPWLEKPFGIDMSAAHANAINHWSRASLKPENLSSEPQLFATLDYKVETEPSHRACLSIEATKTGTVHGVTMWFETELIPGIGFSNAPGEPEQIYGQGFFPLEQPVDLKEGAIATVNMSANYVNGDYVWSWTFAATDINGKSHSFRQSSFKAQVLSPAMIAPRAASFCPPANVIKDIDACCLSCFDGKTNLRAIAEKLLNQFPESFKDTSDALEHVAKLSAKYNGG